MPPDPREEEEAVVRRERRACVCRPGTGEVLTNPTWPDVIRRDVWEAVLTSLARRPEIPTAFGSWGLAPRSAPSLSAPQGFGGPSGNSGKGVSLPLRVALLCVLSPSGVSLITLRGNRGTVAVPANEQPHV